MPVCAVPTCATTHRAVDKILYKFPKDSNYARIWVRCCMKKDTFNTKSAYICSLHFADEAYQRDINHDILAYSAKRSLRKDAVPTLLLPSLRMLQNNSLEYRRLERGSIISDSICSLSPKMGGDDIQMDFFHCSRVHKFHVRLYHPYMKYRTNSVSSDMSFGLSAQKDDLSAKHALGNGNSDAESKITSTDGENCSESEKHVS